MKDSELYELYRNYNPDKDCNGNYRNYIMTLIARRFGSIWRFNQLYESYDPIKEKMFEKLKSLQKEACEEKERQRSA